MAEKLIFGGEGLWRSPGLCRIGPRRQQVQILTHFFSSMGCMWSRVGGARSSPQSVSVSCHRLWGRRGWAELDPLSSSMLAPLCESLLGKRTGSCRYHRQVLKNHLVVSKSTPSPHPFEGGCCWERHLLPVTGAALIKQKQKQNHTWRGGSACAIRLPHPRW